MTLLEIAAQLLAAHVARYGWPVVQDAPSMTHREMMLQAQRETAARESLALAEALWDLAHEMTPERTD